MHKNNDKLLLLSGVTLGLGALVKYQGVIGGLIMLVTGSLLWRKRLRYKFSKFLLILLIAGSVVLSWIFFRFGHAQDWLYVLQVGSEHTLTYSERFPLPIFYLREMVSPYSDIHPISFPLFFLALFGLGFWLWRRKDEDKFGLIWFFVVYSFFTLLPAKSWRYITLVFPVLAVSAAELIHSLWDKIKDGLDGLQIRRKTEITKVVAVVFIFLAIIPVLYYSSQDTYQWVEKDRFQISVEDASQYVASQSELSDTIVVLCPSNFFYADTIQFFLEKYNTDYRHIYQYPEKAVDAYPPSFNVTELIQFCENSNVEFLLLYQTGDLPFFQSELTSRKVYQKMNSTDRFSLEAEFGEAPRKVFVFSFLS